MGCPDITVSICTNIMVAIVGGGGDRQARGIYLVGVEFAERHVGSFCSLIQFDPVFAFVGFAIVRGVIVEL